MDVEESPPLKESASFAHELRKLPISPWFFFPILIDDPGLLIASSISALTPPERPPATDLNLLKNSPAPIEKLQVNRYSSSKKYVPIAKVEWIPT